MTAYDAVILAGGRARRLGGIDKPGLRFGGRTLLDVALAACSDARRTAVVGPRRETSREVRWCREDPPLRGPAAALATGVRALGPGAAPIVAVLAADLPLIDPGTVRRLLAAAEPDPGAGAGVDGAVLIDAEGARQWLVAAYRTTPLLAALDASAPGGSLRALLSGLALAEVADPSGAGRDCDTLRDLEELRRMA